MVASCKLQLNHLYLTKLYVTYQNRLQNLELLLFLQYLR